MQTGEYLCKSTFVCNAVQGLQSLQNWSKRCKDAEQVQCENFSIRSHQGAHQRCVPNGDATRGEGTDADEEEGLSANAALDNHQLPGRLDARSYYRSGR